MASVEWWDLPSQIPFIAEMRRKKEEEERRRQAALRYQAAPPQGPPDFSASQPAHVIDYYTEKGRREGAPSINRRPQPPAPIQGPALPERSLPSSYRERGGPEQDVQLAPLDPWVKEWQRKQAEKMGPQPGPMDFLTAPFTAPIESARDAYMNSYARKLFDQKVNDTEWETPTPSGPMEPMRRYEPIQRQPLPEVTDPDLLAMQQKFAGIEGWKKPDPNEEPSIGFVPDTAAGWRNILRLGGGEGAEQVDNLRYGMDWSQSFFDDWRKEQDIPFADKLFGTETPVDFGDFFYALKQTFIPSLEEFDYRLVDGKWTSNDVTSPGAMYNRFMDSLRESSGFVPPPGADTATIDAYGYIDASLTPYTSIPDRQRVLDELLAPQGAESLWNEALRWHDIAANPMLPDEQRQEAALKSATIGLRAEQLRTQRPYKVIDANRDPWGEIAFGLVGDPTGLATDLIGLTMDTARLTKSASAFDELYNVTMPEAVKRLASSSDEATAMLGKQLQRTGGAWANILPLSLTRESRAAIDQARLFEQSALLMSGVDTIEDARSLHSTWAQNPNALLEGMGGLTSPRLREFLDPQTGLVHLQPTWLGSKRYADSRKVLVEVKDAINKLPALQGVGPMNSQLKLVAMQQMNELLETAAKKKWGLTKGGFSADIPTAAISASVREDKKLGAWLVEYKGPSGNVVDVRQVANQTVGQQMVKRTAEANQMPINRMQHWTDIQRGMMSAIYLNMRPGHWVRNGTSAYAHLFVDDAISFAKSSDIDKWMDNLYGTAPTVRLAEGQGSAEQYWTGGVKGGREKTKNPIANLNRAGSNIWGGDTTMPGTFGRMAVGEQNFYKRAFYSAAQTAMARETRRTLADSLGQAGILAFQDGKKVADSLVHAAQQGLTSYVDTLGEIVRGRRLAFSPSDFGIDEAAAASVQNPEFWRQFNDIVERGRQLLDPDAYTREIDDLFRNELMMPGMNHRQTPQQMGPEHFTPETEAEDFSDFTRRAQAHGRRAGLSEPEMQAITQEAEQLTRQFQDGRKAAEEQLAAALAGSVDPKTMPLVVDVWAEVWRLKDEYRRMQGELFETVADAGFSTPAWQKYWADARQIVADTYQKQIEKLQEAAQNIASGTVAGAERFDNLIKRALEYDPAEVEIAQGLIPRGVEDPIYKRVIEANRMNEDYADSLLWFTAKEVPDAETLDALISLNKQRNGIYNGAFAAKEELYWEAKNGNISWGDYRSGATQIMREANIASVETTNAYRYALTMKLKSKIIGPQLQFPTTVQHELHLPGYPTGTSVQLMRKGKVVKLTKDVPEGTAKQFGDLALGKQGKERPRNIVQMWTVRTPDGKLYDIPQYAQETALIPDEIIRIWNENIGDNAEVALNRVAKEVQAKVDAVAPRQPKTPPKPPPAEPPAPVPVPVEPPRTPPAPAAATMTFHDDTGAEISADDFMKGIGRPRSSTVPFRPTHIGPDDVEVQATLQPNGTYRTVAQDGTEATVPASSFTKDRYTPIGAVAPAAAPPAPTGYTIQDVVRGLTDIGVEGGDEAKPFNNTHVNWINAHVDGVKIKKLTDLTPDQYPAVMRAIDERPVSAAKKAKRATTKAAPAPEAPAAETLLPEQEMLPVATRVTQAIQEPETLSLQSQVAIGSHDLRREGQAIGLMDDDALMKWVNKEGGVKAKSLANLSPEQRESVYKALRQEKVARESQTDIYQMLEAIRAGEPEVKPTVGEVHQEAQTLVAEVKGLKELKEQLTQHWDMAAAKWEEIGDVSTMARRLGAAGGGTPDARIGGVDWASWGPLRDFADSLLGPTATTGDVLEYLKDYVRNNESIARAERRLNELKDIVGATSTTQMEAMIQRRLNPNFTKMTAKTILDDWGDEIVKFTQMPMDELRKLSKVDLIDMAKLTHEASNAATRTFDFTMPMTDETLEALRKYAGYGARGKDRLIDYYNQVVMNGRARKMSNTWAPAPSDIAGHLTEDRLRLYKQMRSNPKQILAERPSGWTSEQLEQFRQWARTDGIRIFENARAGSMNAGRAVADFAMLDYSKRRNIDKWNNFAVPYHYWYTRSFGNWLQRSIEKPEILANWMRYEKQKQDMHEREGTPTRLQNKLPIPGTENEYWVADPSYYALPYAQYLGMYRFEDEKEMDSTFARIVDGTERWGFGTFPLYKLGVTAYDQAKQHGMNPQNWDMSGAAFSLPQAQVATYGAQALWGRPPGSYPGEAWTEGRGEFDPYLYIRSVAYLVEEGKIPPEHGQWMQDWIGQRYGLWEGALKLEPEGMEKYWDMVSKRTAQDKWTQVAGNFFLGHSVAALPESEQNMMAASQQYGQMLNSPESPFGSKAAASQVLEENPELPAWWSRVSGYSDYEGDRPGVKATTSEFFDAKEEQDRMVEDIYKRSPGLNAEGRQAELARVGYSDAQLDEQYSEANLEPGAGRGRAAYEQREADYRQFMNEALYDKDFLGGQPPLSASGDNWVTRRQKTEDRKLWEQRRNRELMRQMEEAGLSYLLQGQDMEAAIDAYRYKNMTPEELASNKARDQYYTEQYQWMQQTEEKFGEDVWEAWDAYSAMAKKREKKYPQYSEMNAEYEAMKAAREELYGDITQMNADWNDLKTKRLVQFPQWDEMITAWDQVKNGTGAQKRVFFDNYPWAPDAWDMDNEFDDNYPYAKQAWAMDDKFNADYPWARDAWDMNNEITDKYPYMKEEFWAYKDATEPVWPFEGEEFDYAYKQSAIPKGSKAAVAQSVGGGAPDRSALTSQFTDEEWGEIQSAREIYISLKTPEDRAAFLDANPLLREYLGLKYGGEKEPQRKASSYSPGVYTPSSGGGSGGSVGQSYGGYYGGGGGYGGYSRQQPVMRQETPYVQDRYMNPDLWRSKDFLPSWQPPRQHDYDWWLYAGRQLLPQNLQAWRPPE